MFYQTSVHDNDSSFAFQTVLQGIAPLTAAGPGSARASELVVAGLIIEVAVTLRLQMAASLAWATRWRRATRNLVQVRLGVCFAVLCVSC